MFGDVEDDGYSSFGGGRPGGMPGGMPGMGGFGRRPQGPEKVEAPLKLTLEELYTGTTKKLKVTRRVYDAASGQLVPVQEVLEVPVKAGWKEGTRITFEGKGDELPNRPAQDVVFVIKQERHLRFLREGDDLIVKAGIPLDAALGGGKVDIPTLDNRILRVPLKEVVTPTYERIVPNEGMPNSKTGQKGNLRIRFEVQFPKKQLSETEQRQLHAMLADKF